MQRVVRLEVRLAKHRDQVVERDRLHRLEVDEETSVVPAAHERVRDATREGRDGGEHDEEIVKAELLACGDRVRRQGCGSPQVLGCRGRG
ncbi:MAG: hypothetical protein H6723_15830 [Sandaracinus sp.]|nr:hypothetical protein [Sandaracinus sp.]